MLLSFLPKLISCTPPFMFHRIFPNFFCLQMDWNCTCTSRPSLKTQSHKNHHNLTPYGGNMDFQIDPPKNYRNHSLGLATKVRTCKGVSQEWSLRVTFHAPESVGVWESVKKWTSTLPSELPLWELESQWTPDGLPNFQRAIEGVKTPLDWIVPYIIRKLLELRCLKWDSMTHLGN
jgi:hypothetical protein